MGHHSFAEVEKWRHRPAPPTSRMIDERREAMEEAKENNSQLLSHRLNQLKIARHHRPNEIVDAILYDMHSLQARISTRGSL